MLRETEGACQVIHPQQPAIFARTPATLARRTELHRKEMPGLSLALLARRLHRWWMGRVERHCLICADVEEQCARQAQQNVAYYQKQAALARSAQL